MEKIILSAVGALVLTSMPAHAASVIFTPGGSVGTTYPSLKVIDTFSNASGIASGSNYKIKVSPTDGEGAVIPVPSTGDSYLSVLGGGNALINLPANTLKFAFDWGSLDTYNTLRVTFGNNLFQDFIPGGNLPGPGDGNQFLPSTNGVVAGTANPGESFKSIQLFSGNNSFEGDNLAVAGIPEPSTWALMMLGIGAIGAGLRRKRRSGSLSCG
jgi:PEP-CTERM motif